MFKTPALDDNEEDSINDHIVIMKPIVTTLRQTDFSSLLDQDLADEFEELKGKKWKKTELMKCKAKIEVILVGKRWDVEEKMAKEQSEGGREACHF